MSLPIPSRGAFHHCPLGVVDKVLTYLPFSDRCSAARVSRHYHKGAFPGITFQQIEDSRFEPIVKGVLKRSLAIHRELRESHYTFFHGISCAMGVFNWVKRSLSGFAEQQEFACMAATIPQPTSLTDIRTLVRQGMEGQPPGADPYHRGKFHDCQYRGEILSVSPFLLDNGGAESAAYFVSINGSFSYPNEDRCNQVFIDYLAGVPEAAKLVVGLAGDLFALIKEEHRSRGSGTPAPNRGGIMAILSLPKELVLRPPDRAPVYRSHPGGFPCECANLAQDQRTAEHFFTSSLPALCNNGAALQYRIILTAEVRAKMRSRVLDCAPREATAAWQAKAAEIVARAKKLKAD